MLDDSFNSDDWLDSSNMVMGNILDLCCYRIIFIREGKLQNWGSLISTEYVSN